MTVTRELMKSHLRTGAATTIILLHPKVARVQNRAANDPSVFTTTENSPARALSWLKAPTTGSPKIIDIYKFRLRAIKMHQIKF